MNEQRLLAQIAAQMPDPSVLTDDAFLDPDTRLIFTTDMLVAGRHFDEAYFSPEDLAWKALGVNASDIAAMGANDLRFVLVSLGLPTHISPEFVDRFYAALQNALEAYGGRLIGGDTVGAEVLTINVTAVGHLPVERSLGSRSNARVGDAVLLCGQPGLSRIGLTVLKEELSGFPEARQTHLRPIPRLLEAKYLSESFSRLALMDTSDGLADAAIQIARRSGVRLSLSARDIPIHAEIKAFQQAHPDLWNTLETPELYGGEDFDLLATVPAKELEAKFSGKLAGFQCIGHVVAGESGAFLVDAQGSEIEELCLERTYQHFGA